jgi:curved DNA-binding protein
MKFKDYYRIMGVSPQATAEEIKTAYRKLARKYHPDVSKEPDTVRRFTDLGEAKEVLEDPARRAAYDQLRAAGWREGQEMDAPPPARPSAGAGTGDADDEAAGFSDFFQSFFGHQPPPAGGRRRGPFRRHAFHERGDDIHAAFPVTLEEAYAGATRAFTLRVPGVDEHGAPVGGQRTIEVRIPKGVVDGDQVRLRGQGHPGDSAEHNGDLYLEIEVAPHHLYRVDGRDVALELPIAPWEAVLGAQVAVPTLGGTVTATIPPGAQHGQKLRLRGRGLPGDPPGDQYLELVIALPPQASERAKALYRDLARESAFNPRAKLGV